MFIFNRIAIWLSRPVVRRSIFFTCIGLLLAFEVVFLCRGAILRGYVERKTQKIEARFGLDITYSKLNFSGLSTISIENLSVVPKGRDTLLSVRDLSVRLSPWRMLFAKVDITYLQSHSLHLQFVKGDSCSNYDFIYPPIDSLAADTTQDEDIAPNTNYAREVERVFDIVFGLLPSDAVLVDSRLGYRRGDYALTIALPDLNISDNVFRTQILVSEPDHLACWIGEGELSDGDRNLRLKLYSKSDPQISMPFLPFRCKARVTFDTLALNLVQQRAGRDLMTVSGIAAISGLGVFHEGISPTTVLLDRGTFDYKVNVGSNFIELDSATTACFNKLSFHPYLRAERNARWHFRASINKNSFAADDLFSSLPRGLFSNLEGILTEGKLSYHMLFDVDLACVDSLKLESQLKREGFRIKRYGATDLRRMNSEFTYTAYDNGVPIRTFAVGDSNPNFRPLTSISPLLQMTVMQSEDGAFFRHNGFLLDCMRAALVEDIKQRRFARGGSTISMQLVKNVFLSRHKTIARKVEEAMIVWLIEGGRLTSKERMFEVYMNIIEWGRGVYGAEEAARYYFDKDASQLNINESIFLAGIIPSPKRALGSFTDSLTLRPYLAGYFRIMAQRLAVKGLIEQEQADLIVPEVVLKGAAREAVLSRHNTIEMADSTAIGVINYTDFEFMPVSATPPTP